MKNILVTLVFVLILSCEKEQSADYVLISGQFENSKFETFSISNNGFDKEIPINPENGIFSDTLFLSGPGFFDLRLGRDNTEVYLVPGFNLNVIANESDFNSSLKFSGEGAEPNAYLAAKKLNTEKLKPEREKFYALEEPRFKEKVMAIKTSNENLLKEMIQNDEAFTNYESDNLKYEAFYWLNDYEGGHRYYTEQPEFKASDNLLPEELKLIVYDDTEAYDMSKYYYYLARGNVLDEIMEKTYNNNKASIEVFEPLNSIKIPKLKEDVLKTLPRLFISARFENLDAFYNYFIENTSNEELKKEITAKYNTTKSLVKGNPSPQFVNYENHKGGTTSLSDLKGKYVYIDVWATWCVPCIKEIPSLKAVEKKYHDKNIEFVSTSIDREKDYNTWVSMVNEQELSGMQLMADNNIKSDFIRSYDISGIPHFILIDPNGNIVSADAPRPSDPKLIDMFNELDL